jgi:hypothetical protein
MSKRRMGIEVIRHGRALPGGDRKFETVLHVIRRLDRLSRREFERGEYPRCRAMPAVLFTTPMASHGESVLTVRSGLLLWITRLSNFRSISHKPAREANGQPRAPSYPRLFNPLAINHVIPDTDSRLRPGISDGPPPASTGVANRPWKAGDSPSPIEAAREKRNESRTSTAPILPATNTRRKSGNQSPGGQAAAVRLEKRRGASTHVFRSAILVLSSLLPLPRATFIDDAFDSPTNK